MAEPMKIRAVLQADVADVKVLMSHPMETGQRKDANGNLVPVHFIQQVSATLNGKVVLDAPYGTIRLDKNRQAIIDVYDQVLYTGADGKLAIKTVAKVSHVDQTFGGTFSAKTPAPGRTFPACVKRSLPWQGKIQTINFGK